MLNNVHGMVYAIFSGIQCINVLKCSNSIYQIIIFFKYA